MSSLPSNVQQHWSVTRKVTEGLLLRCHTSQTKKFHTVWIVTEKETRIHTYILSSLHDGGGRCHVEFYQKQ